MNDVTKVAIIDKKVLTLAEASMIYSVSVSTLKNRASEFPHPEWVLMDGRKILLKRKQFEMLLDQVDTI